jgi:aromatic ring-opening dioxygenase catalytic subunit (LigB family)
MMLLRPQADLPIVQISIPQGDKIPERAIAWGKALESFRDEGWAILGSGHTYHNFEAIIGPIMNVPGAPNAPDNRAFEDKLEEVVTLKDKNKRLEEIANWRSFPLAEAVQPTGSDEHFTPFLVNMGAAGSDVGKKLGEWGMFGTVSSSYIWA